MLRHPRRVRTMLTALGTAVLTTAVATGCVNIGASDGADTRVPLPVSVGREACTKYGKNISLTVGISETGQAIAEQDARLAAQFEKRNPNVRVNLRVRDFASSRTTIKLAMSGSEPPDLMQGNTGWAINGALWQAGLVKDLEPYATAYGWNERFAPQALNSNRFTADGTAFGRGKLVAVPQAVQYVGVFYNKKLLRRIGVADPAELDDKETFLRTLDKAKSAGTTPVMLGDAEKNWALHNLSQFNAWHVPPQEITDWVYGKPGSTYDDAQHVRAAEDFQNWMKKGYFNSDALSTSFDDAQTRFSRNESAFFVTGSWALADLEEKMGDNVGFMLWPAGDNGRHAAVGGYSLPFSVSAKTRYPDCAAALLDFMTASPEAVDAQLASGRPSATKAGLTVRDTDPLLRQMITGYRRLNEENGLFPWEDWPTPTMLTIAQSESQLLLADEISPRDYTSAIQENWDDYVKHD